MFARTTTISGSPDGIDQAIAFVQDEAMPGLMRMPGCLGMSFVVDRATGRCIATSSWETQEQMRASDGDAAPMRARAAQIVGGAPAVEEWEVAIMHRDHVTADGACCRVTWVRTPDVDRLHERFREGVLPRLEALDGFCSASLLADRAGGRMCATAVFDSHAALDASRDRMAALRDQTASMMDVEFTEVAEFDLAMAHLRLPELV